MPVLCGCVQVFRNDESIGWKARVEERVAECECGFSFGTVDKHSG